ncbi:hypothetical protein [Mesobacillus maritimus]
MIKKMIGLTSTLVLSLGLTACGGSNTETSSTPESVGEQVEYEIVGIDPG